MYEKVGHYYSQKLTILKTKQSDDEDVPLLEVNQIQISIYQDLNRIKKCLISIYPENNLNDNGVRKWIVESNEHDL